MIMCQIYSMASFREIVKFMIEIQSNQMIFTYDLQGLMQGNLAYGFMEQQFGMIYRPPGETF